MTDKQTNNESRSSASGFKATGTPDLRDNLLDEIDQLPDDMLDPRKRLARMVHREIANKPFSELTAVTYDHEGAQLAGHVMLDTLEEQGFSVDDFDAVGALTTAAIPLVSAVMHAAASRGQSVDGFVMDFVYPSIKGPSIEGKRVILLDAWLSEKSFIQTSSLVTLQNGNELNLDFAILDKLGADLLAIASLVGSLGIGSAGTEGSSSNETGSQDNFDATSSSDEDLFISVINPITGVQRSVRFIPLFRG